MPAKPHAHAFKRGGKCSRCDVRCPHPVFAPTPNGPTCTTCGCLKPLEGSADFYELALGPPQYCKAGMHQHEEFAMGPDWAAWHTLRTGVETGEFKPLDWNWAVGENSALVPDTTAPKGFSYKKRVCIYIMGQGAEQCLQSFVLHGDVGPERIATAKQMIRDAFGVDRIIDGVG